MSEDDREAVLVHRKDGTDVWVPSYYAEDIAPDTRFGSMFREGKLKKLPAGWRADDVAELTDGSFVEL